MGRDALSDRCGGGGGGGATKLGGGGSITSAGCVGGDIASAGLLCGGGEVERVHIGRGQVVRAAGGGDMTAVRCRRMGCNRLTGGVVVLVMTVAAAAAATTGVVVVAVVVVGVVTVALQPVSSMFMKDTAVALRGRGAGGVFLALTAVHDVKIPGGTHAKRPRTWDNVPSLSITIRSCNNTDKLPVTIYSHLYYNTLLSGLNHPIIIIHKTTQKLLSGLNHLITSIKLVIHKTNQKC